MCDSDSVCRAPPSTCILRFCFVLGKYFSLPRNVSRDISGQSGCISPANDSAHVRLGADRNIAARCHSDQRKFRSEWLNPCVQFYAVCESNGTRRNC